MEKEIHIFETSIDSFESISSRTDRTGKESVHSELDTGVYFLAARFHGPAFSLSSEETAGFSAPVVIL